MKKKTVLDWVQEFPEPYKGMALANLRHPDAPASSRMQALARGFDWAESKEGSSFWHAIATHVEAMGNFPIFSAFSGRIKKQDA